MKGQAHRTGQGRHARRARTCWKSNTSSALVAFDSQPHKSVPLQYVRARRVEDLIDRIQASGQTNIYPALAIAYRGCRTTRPRAST